jgi:hypothetical protein
VFTIHGSLLAIGELILTLSEEDIHKEVGFYEVSLPVTLLLTAEYSNLSRETSCIRQKVGSRESGHDLISTIHPMHLRIQITSLHEHNSNIHYPHRDISAKE